MVPLRTWVKSYNGLSTVWSILFEDPYGAWILTLIFFLLSASRKNTLNVTLWFSESKEKHLETQILSLEAEKKKQEKLINKLKSI